jgi:hypothetical protein
MPGVERLPRSQWKLYNLRRMDPTKRLAPKNCFNRNLDDDALLAGRPASLLPGTS